MYHLLIFLFSIYISTEQILRVIGVILFTVGLETIRIAHHTSERSFRKRSLSYNCFELEQRCKDFLYIALFIYYFIWVEWNFYIRYAYAVFLVTRILSDFVRYTISLLQNLRISISKSDLLVICYYPLAENQKVPLWLNSVKS